MTADVVRDVVAGALLLSGAVLAFGAGVGLVRFPDLLSRMHAATKPQVLGLVLALLGLAVRLGGVPVVWMLLLVVMFQLLTSPVAAHMVARAGYRTGKIEPEHLKVDELTRDLRAAERELGERGEAADAASAELLDAEVDEVAEVAEVAEPEGEGAPPPGGEGVDDGPGARPRDVSGA